MINLMPTQEVEDIVYARRNTRLMRWAFAAILALVGVAAIVSTGRLIIDNSAERVSRQVTSAQDQLKVQKVDEVEARVEDISASLKLATQVLSRQVILSGLIQHIGTVLPNGTVLSGLQLSKIEGGMDLAIIATDYQSATQVQINLEDPSSKLFKQADIINITCTGGTDPRYPCQASFRLLFADDNPYTFLKQGTAS